MSAYVSAFSRSAMLSLQRNLSRSHRRNGIPVAPVAEHHLNRTWDNGLAGESPLDVIASRRGLASHIGLTVDEAHEREVFEAAAASHLARSKHTRAPRLTHLQAMALCHGFGVEAPERIEDDQAAARVRGVLASDPKAASTVVSLLARYEAASADLDADLVRMWESQPRRILELLAAADPRVAQTISMSAASPIPPLDRSNLKLLRRHCIALLDGQSGSQRLNATITAWAEHVSGLRVSEYFGGITDPMARENIKTATEREEDRAAFVAAVEDMVGAGVTTLGTTPESVAAELRTRFAAIEDEAIAQRAV